MFTGGESNVTVAVCVMGTPLMVTETMPLPAVEAAVRVACHVPSLALKVGAFRVPAVVAASTDSVLDLIGRPVESFGVMVMVERETPLANKPVGEAKTVVVAAATVPT